MKKTAAARIATTAAPAPARISTVTFRFGGVEYTGTGASLVKALGQVAEQAQAERAGAAPQATR